MPPLTPDREIALIERYTNSSEIRVIAADFSVSVQTVYNVLRRHGIKIRKQRLRDDAVLVIDAARNGDTLKRAAETLRISQSTITRRVRDRRNQGEVVVVRRGRPPKSVRFLESGGDLDVARLRLLPFPYPRMLSVEECRKEFDRLLNLKSFLDGDVIRPQNTVGVKLCVPFFLNRYEATAKGGFSAVEAWRKETEIKKAVRFQLRYGDPITPDRVLRAITLRCRTPTVFRPGVARFVYERYCPSGGRVWDPCAGYGGRLLGAISVGVQYVGTDVDERTVAGNLRLAHVLGVNAEMYVSPAEIFDPGAVDLVFTSPPYFDREHYSEAESQSWKKYGKELESWVEGFLRPVVKRAYHALQEGGNLVLNVADIRERGAVIPIVARTISVASESGFQHVETLRMPLASINRNRQTLPSEPVLVFQKQRPCSR